VKDVRPRPVFEAADGRVVRSFGEHLRHALHFRTFLGYWVLRNVVTRYRQTVLGPLWALLQPLLGSLIYAFVFGLLLRVDTGGVPYTLFVITNLVLWAYSARMIINAPGYVIANLNIVTRVQFPRECLVLVVWLEAMADLVLGLVVLAGFFVYHGTPLTVYAFGALAVFAVHTTFALGLAFLVSAVSIIVRDLLYILPIVLQLLLYLAPVVYPLEILPPALRPLYLANPLAVIFSAYQETLLFGRFTLYGPLALSAATSALLLVSGYALFKRLEWKLVDVL
jgi:lipopolysaccharide transport system permease protein